MEMDMHTLVSGTCISAALCAVNSRYKAALDCIFVYVGDTPYMRANHDCVSQSYEFLQQTCLPFFGGQTIIKLSNFKTNLSIPIKVTIDQTRHPLVHMKISNFLSNLKSSAFKSWFKSNEQYQMRFADKPSLKVHRSTVPYLRGAKIRVYVRSGISNDRNLLTMDMQPNPSLVFLSPSAVEHLYHRHLPMRMKSAWRNNFQRRTRQMGWSRKEYCKRRQCFNQSRWY